MAWRWSIEELVAGSDEIYALAARFVVVVGLRSRAVVLAVIMIGSEFFLSLAVELFAW